MLVHSSYLIKSCCFKREFSVLVEEDIVDISLWVNYRELIVGEETNVFMLFCLLICPCDNIVRFIVSKSTLIIKDLELGEVIFHNEEVIEVEILENLVSPELIFECRLGFVLLQQNNILLIWNINIERVEDTRVVILLNEQSNSIKAGRFTANTQISYYSVFC